MGLLDRKPGQENPDKFTTFRCPKCPFKTKQLRAVKQVMHHCPKTKTYIPLKEDT